MATSLAVVCLALPARPQPARSEFEDLYLDLGRALGEFESHLASHWSGERHDVTFGAELLTANSHRGERLLAPDGLAGNLLYLDRLQALGVHGVNLQNILAGRYSETGLAFSRLVRLP